jgi:hypothetical protein
MVKTLGLALAVAAAMAGGSVQARDVYWSVNVQAPLYPAGSISSTWSNARPAPVYVRPVYAQPVYAQPVVVQPVVLPAPVMYRPVVVRPAPYPVMVYGHPYRHHKAKWRYARHHRDHHHDDDD